MKRIFTFCLVLLTFICKAQEFTVWDFTGDVTTPSLGSGSLALIGGTTASFAGGISGGRAYNTSGYPASTANNETAGVRFNVSTVGRTGIVLFWSQRHSNTSSKFTKIQISTDGTNFTTVDLNSTNTNGSTGNFDFVNDILEATTGDTWFARRLDLTGNTAVENNPNFAFRIVTSFGTGTSYVATTSTSLYATGGTIRFDDVAVGANSILPITLTSFTGFINNNKAVLQWKTASEINFSHFEVEKSINGIQFASVATVKGTSTNGANYSYTDATINGKAYYRLKSIDKDGTFSYSHIVELENAVSTAVQVYPNPINASVVINHSITEKGYVRIATIEGKILLQQNIVANATQTIVNTNTLNKGTYLVQVLLNGKLYNNIVTK